MLNYIMPREAWNSEAGFLAMQPFFLPGILLLLKELSACMFFFNLLQTSHVAMTTGAALKSETQQLPLDTSEPGYTCGGAHRSLPTEEL